MKVIFFLFLSFNLMAQTNQFQNNTLGNSVFDNSKPLYDFNQVFNHTNATPTWYNTTINVNNFNDNSFRTINIDVFKMPVMTTPTMYPANPNFQNIWINTTTIIFE